MSRPPIRRLPREVVERIAAGEVVERPASVVKELVENALDAGATAIEVGIEGGGLGLIRVSDDGGGIPEADLALALSAHATSKLSDVDDLAHIASFGFRGEALSSIAAVSRCRITSRAAGVPDGATLESLAGEPGRPHAAARPQGTTIEVRDLFFNTPARRRFLSSAPAEAARCRELCAALSLVNAGVRFRFSSEGEPRFTSDGEGGLRERIATVHGEELAREMLPVEGRAEGLLVEGFLSRPSAARPRPRAQQLFVNRRLVRDRAVLAAVRSACKDFLPPSLQAAWVLCLDVDPARVDVNVHPTKAEVRFRDKDAVFSLLRGACRQALLAADLRPSVKAEHFPAGPFAAGGFAGAAQAQAAAAAQASGLATGARAGASSAGEARADPLPRGRRKAPDGASWVAPAPPAARAFLPAATYLQVLDTYLVHDDPDGLVLVDQHALHERILYARLQRDLEEGRIESQSLLLPEPVRLPPLLHARALEEGDALARMGLRVEAFGPDTVAVHAVPAVLRRERLDELLVALLDPPELHGGIPHGLDRRLFTIACHAAVRAGDRLREEEIEDLLRQGAELEHDATCPHGRPTRLRISRTELERLFKRSGF